MKERYQVGNRGYFIATMNCNRFWVLKIIELMKSNITLPCSPSDNLV